MEPSVSSRVLRRAEKELAQTKVIIRHLPPDFTEEKLKSVIDPFPSNDYFVFVPGNPELGKFGCSRAYINLKKLEDVMTLRDTCDGLPLESDKGVKYRIIIELAPYQIIPRGRVKSDHRCGTIQDDAEYKEFLEKYERPVDPLPSVDVTYIHEVEKMKVESLQATPLTEYLRNKYTVPRGHRSSKNKVLYATGSKKRRDKGSNKESLKGSSKSGKTFSRKEKEGGKAGGEKKSSKEPPPSEPARIIVMDKGKGGGTSSSMNGIDKRGGSRGTTKTESSSGEGGRRSGGGQKSDQPFYGHGKSSGSRRGGSSGGGSKEKKDDVVIVNHGERGGDSGKRRGGRSKDGYSNSGGYSKYGRGQDRRDNHYEFKEDNDSYQGPDYAGTKGSRNRYRDDYKHDERPSGGGGGRYHGRGRNNDQYESSKGGGGGWDRGYRSHNK